MKRLWIILNLAYHMVKLELAKMEKKRLEKEFLRLYGKNVWQEGDPVNEK